MNLRRLVLAGAAATLAAAALVPAAQAATTVAFSVSYGSSARVEIGSSDFFTRFDVTRSGAVIGSSSTGRLELTDLLPDDVVTVYNATTALKTITYDGLPAVGSDACLGRTGFLVQRGVDAELLEAGARDEYGDDVPSSWSDVVSGPVKLARPLAPYDVAYARTYASDGETSVYSSRFRRMQPCDNEIPKPPPPPPAPPAPPITPTELTPTTAQLTRAVKGSISATGSSLRTRTTRRLARVRSVALPFAFPEPGRVELQLVASSHVIGSGARTSAVNGKVILAVKLTPAGRKLLKRSKTLKVTVKGAFTASRTGAETSRASSTVTLKR